MIGLSPPPSSRCERAALSTVRASSQEGLTVTTGGTTRFFCSHVISMIIGLGCLPSAAAPLDLEGRSGSIRGRVIWTGAAIPRFKDLQLQGQAERDPQVCARERAIPDGALLIDPGTKGVRDAVVYLP